LPGSGSSQPLLFEILALFPIDFQVKVFCSVAPPWVSWVNSGVLSQLVTHVDWGVFAAEMLGAVVVPVGYGAFRDNILSDGSVVTLVTRLVDQLRPGVGALPRECYAPFSICLRKLKNRLWPSVSSGELETLGISWIILTNSEWHSMLRL
jgi:hypothetical protein